MLTIKDFRLGRISFPTLEDALAETVGESLEVVGAGLTAGERKPKPMELTIPVRASQSEANPYADGDRMRRQVRSLMDNSAARLSGLYATVAFDTELNGWLLVGGGKLEYDEGGVTFADYKLVLSDSYVVGRRRSHRPARRAQVYDRRLITTPRDYERIVYSTAFAATSTVAKIALPYGAQDIRARNAFATAVTQNLPTADGGSASIITGASNGDVFSFEQPESAEMFGDVVILDRRGNPAPAEIFSIAEPQAAFGWEEVYGPDYPLTPEDIPVIQNGLCRIRQVHEPGATKNMALALDQFEGGFWNERSRIVPGVVGLCSEEVISCAVKEWTPDRGVICFRCVGGSGQTVDVYVILQRGWTGPRIEMYARPTSFGGSPTPFFNYHANAAEEMYLATSLAIKVSNESWTGNITATESFEPWAAYAPIGGGGFSHLFAVGSVPTKFEVFSGSEAYGSSRKAFQIQGSTATSILSGWLGVDIRLGVSETSKFEDAETSRNTSSGTAQIFTDVEASDGEALVDSQAAETAAMLLEASGGTAFGLSAGNSYRVYARVKIVPAYKAAVRLSTPISLWSLNEVGAVNALDFMEKNTAAPNGGLTRNVTTLLPDLEGACTTFNGTTGFFSIPDSASLEVKDTFSIEAWIKPSAIGAARVILAGGTEEPELRVSAAGHLQLLKNGVSIVESTNTFVANTVYHVCATKTGVTVKLYVNGADVTGTVTNATCGNTATAWTIGRRATASELFFVGSMQYVAIYSVALAAATVLAHYEARTTLTQMTLNVRFFGGAIQGSIAFLSNPTYVWKYVGTAQKAAASERLDLTGVRSAGTNGLIYIDQILTVPAQTTQADGPVDLGQASLSDAQGIAELVSR